MTRILGLALAASVLINVFVLGFWVARQARPGRGMRGEAWSEGEVDTSAPMREIWKKQSARLGPRREAVDAARRLVRETLMAEPFKPEALEAALATLRSETDQTQAVLHRALVDFARDLGPEDRRRLAVSRWFLGAPPREGRGH